jgi:hypothetical protein
MRYLAAIGLLLGMVTICSADDGTGADLDEKWEKSVKQIPSIIEQYATSIGCEFHMSKSNVVPYDIGGLHSYVAVFSIDNGCSGGSAMSRPVFVVLQPVAYDKILVNAAYSAPHQTAEEFPGLVTNIFLKDGKLWFKAKAYDLTKDALCCPSVPVTGQVEYQGGKWVPITNQLPNPAYMDSPRTQES